jgi:hypothetical protein
MLAQKTFAACQGHRNTPSYYAFAGSDPSYTFEYGDPLWEGLRNPHLAAL